jgi:hypothetical protein
MLTPDPQQATWTTPCSHSRSLIIIQPAIFPKGSARASDWRFHAGSSESILEEKDTPSHRASLLFWPAFVGRGGAATFRPGPAESLGTRFLGCKIRMMFILTSSPLTLPLPTPEGREILNSISWLHPEALGSAWYSPESWFCYPCENEYSCGSFLQDFLMGLGA